MSLFRQSDAGWSPPTSVPDPIPAGPTTWEALRPFLEEKGSNAFVRNLVRAVSELYGLGKTGSLGTTGGRSMRQSARITAGRAGARRFSGAVA
jgi:hypothetical protein